MNRSLGEIESLARRAVRGAGYDWAIADESGQAIRWLERHGLPGVAELVRHLERSTDPTRAGARAATPPARPSAAPACPLTTGARLCDTAFDWSRQARPIVVSVVSPMLLVPSIAAAAALTGTVLHLSGSPGEAVLDGRALRLRPGSAWASADVATLSVERIERSVDDWIARPALSRAEPADVDWAGLERFAARTLAPATALSRARGAG